MDNPNKMRYNIYFSYLGLKPSEEKKQKPREHPQSWKAATWGVVLSSSARAVPKSANLSSRDPLMETGSLLSSECFLFFTFTRWMDDAKAPLLPKRNDVWILSEIKKN